MNYLTVWIATAMAIGLANAATTNEGKKPTTTPNAKPTTTDKPTTTGKHTTSKPEKYSCEQCLGKGTDCKGTKSLKTCDYCVKIVGTVDSKTPTPVWAQVFISAMSKGAKAKDYEGQTITVKLCTSKEYITKAGYEPKADCAPFVQMGLKGVGCTCEGECQGPTSVTIPPTVAP